VIGLAADAIGASLREPLSDERSWPMTSDGGGGAVETRSLLAEHERLLDHVAHIRVAALELASLSEEERHELIERIVSFLRDDLAPHAEREERGLYPHVARLLGDPRVTQPMVYDHDAIRQLTARLQDAGNQDVPLLQELLYGLHALITVHLRKEDELYLPLLEREQAKGDL
jgi:hemerythrin-like domain-containing protein